MELEHHFEVPVGIDQAWPHLLDMQKVAACFPGATLSSSDGDEYTGTVKVKLGPIQLTYQGSARIVSADEETHTATIEASGSAPRSGSTAAMTVVAAAKPAGDNRTAVEMKTDLNITGRPAQFGRGVMVEVGNKILGRFADCLSAKLAATDSGAAEEGGSDEGSAAAEVAAASAPASASQGETANNEHDAAAAASPSSNGRPTGSSGPSTYTRAPSTPESEPIDLLESARGSIIKRLAPVAAALVVVVLWRLLRSKNRD
jgi:carbon monoxide dehydrogenase subunit G